MVFWESTCYKLPIQPQTWREANVNELTDPENRDPVSGFPGFKALLCEVELVTGNNKD